MFFVDLQGRVSDPAITEAVAGLEQICEQARVLGSYRASGTPTDARSDRETRAGQSPRRARATATLRRYRWIAPFHL